MLACTLVQFHNSDEPDQTYYSHELTRSGLRATTIGVNVTLRDEVQLGFCEALVLLAELTCAKAALVRITNGDYGRPEWLNVCYN